MARAAKTVCNSCDQRLEPGRPFCGRCAAPTQWASYQQRTEWEVAWYRERNSSVPIRAAYDTTRVPSKNGTAPPRNGTATAKPAIIAEHKGIGALFSRRPVPPEPANPLPTRFEWRRTEPAPRVGAAGAHPTAAAALALAVVPAQPKPERKPEPRLVPAFKQVPPVSSNGNGHPVRLRELPPMVLAVKLLNGRVSEIDARLFAVERTIAERLPLKRRRLWK